jgi:hypothetical protein
MPSCWQPDASCSARNCCGDNDRFCYNTVASLFERGLYGKSFNEGKRKVVPAVSKLQQRYIDMLLTLLRSAAFYQALSCCKVTKLVPALRLATVS